MLKALSGIRHVCPLYHAVSDEVMPHLKYLYSVKSVTQFIRDIDFLASHFMPLPLHEWVKSVSDKTRSPRPSMTLTFDDGMKEVYDIIAPILLEKGIPATFFINPSFVDNRDIFYKYKASLIIDRLEKPGYPESILELIESRMGIRTPGKRGIKKELLELRHHDSGKLDEIAGIMDFDFSTFLKVRKPYLTTDQLNELKSKGFQIGAHSMDHPLYSALEFKDQIRQTRDSIDWVANTFNLDYRYFAFPFTDFGIRSEFFETLYNSEEPMADASFGTAGMKRELYPLHFQRIPMEATGTGAGITLKGEYLYYLLKGPFGKNIIRR